MTDPIALRSMKLTKRLTILYVIALGMIALLTIVGQVVVQRSIRRLEGDSRIVNIAGRQRMLSQRLTRLAIEVSLASIQAGSDDRQNWVETVAMMREDLNTWTVNHAGLQTGSKEMQLPGKNSNAVVQLFQELSPHFDAVKQEIEAVISNSPSSSYSSRRRGFGSNSDAFLVGMDKIVTQLEQEARDRVNRLRWVESMLLIATISVLICEGLFIFSPAVASLKHSLKSLQQVTAELEGAKQAAENANLAKTDFLTRVSHELRTPLHAILGMLGLVERGKLSKSQRSKIHLANEAATSLKSLVDDLLDVAGIEQRLDIAIHPAPTDLQSLFHSTVELMRPHAVEKGLELRLTIGFSVPRCIEVDADRLRQILTNLLQNAVRYTSVGFIRCNVSTVHESNKLLLKVDIEDTGIGIAKQDQASIFDCFERGKQNESVTTFGRSLGLGLSITQANVLRMGGTISLESELGHGSRFTFVLPIQMSVESLKAFVTQSPIHGQDLAGFKTALIVDDAWVNLRLMRSYLKILGCRTRSVQSLHEAIDQFNRRHFDLVLMDKNLPDGDGALFPGMVREYSRQETRVFLVTAEIAPIANLDVGERAFAGVLHKPFSLDQLRQAIQRSILSTDLVDAERVDDADRHLALKHRLAQLVLQLLPQDIAEIKTLIEQQNFKGIAFVAHRLRGAAGNAGLTTIAKSATELEFSAQRADLSSARLCLVQLLQAANSPNS